MVTKSGKDRTRVYGSMKVVDNATETTINSQDTWVKVSDFTAGETKDVTFSNSSLTTVLGGDYQLVSAGVAQPGQANTDYEMAIFKDGGLIDKTDLKFRFGSTSNEPWAVSGFIINLTTNQTIDLRVKNTGGTQNITMTNGSVLINKL